MKLIYRHENRLLVGNIRNILEAEGIEVVLKNEFAQGALGEVSPMDTWPELWLVNAADYLRARKLLETALTAGDAPDWTCGNCAERNGAAFELCWNCSNENPYLRDQD